MTITEVRDLILALLPDWQDRFSIWAVAMGLLLLVAGIGLVRIRREHPHACRESDVLRAYRLGNYHQPSGTPRFGRLLCAIGVAMLAFPFVDVGWFT